jgi:hypothetical protein
MSKKFKGNLSPSGTMVEHEIQDLIIEIRKNQHGTKNHPGERRSTTSYNFPQPKEHKEHKEHDKKSKPTHH